MQIEFSGFFISFFSGIYILMGVARSLTSISEITLLSFVAKKEVIAARAEILTWPESSSDYSTDFC